MISEIILKCIISGKSVIATHSFLIYQHHYFTKSRMSFSGNLPFHRSRLYLYSGVVYLVLIIPETIWLFSSFNPVKALGLLYFGLSTALLFRSILYATGLKMIKYLQWIFSLYILLVMLILFNFYWSIIFLNSIISFNIFYLKYYNQRQDP